MKILVTYDGTLQSKHALRYALDGVKDSGAEVTALHVFHANMLTGYDAVPEARAIARTESLQYVREAEGIIKSFGSDVTASVVMRDGEPAEETVRFASEGSFDLIIAVPKFRSMVLSAPCPVSVIPGVIVVPVDNSEVPDSFLGRIVTEAKRSGSSVIILGIIPVNLYSSSEKAELAAVEKETASVLRKLKGRLAAADIKAKEVMASGYPDEEILGAAAKEAVSMIMFNRTGDAPSELSKAADMLLQDRDLLHQEVVIVPAGA